VTSVASTSLAQQHASILVSPEGRILGWSSTAEGLFGHTAAQALGQNVSALFGAGIIADLGRVRLGGEVRAQRTAWRKDGVELNVELYISRLDLVEGSPQLALVVREASAQRHLEAEVLQQTELEQYLLGVVGHDLRNPLHAVMLTASHLLQRDLDGRMRRGLERIRVSAERGVRMTYDLLDFNRVRRGHGIPIELRQLELAALVRDEVHEALQLRPERKVHVETQGDCVGLFDGDRVRQLVLNLVNNALQHTTEEVAVTVTLECDAEHVVLKVHNNGGPIARDLQARLFQPYVVSHGGVSGGRSLGLGLFIARAIATAHGGTLTMTSDNESGTCFVARLPRSGGPP
jgi:PAS domain S-box-containing protein